MLVNNAKFGLFVYLYTSTGGKDLGCLLWGEIAGSCCPQQPAGGSAAASGSVYLRALKYVTLSLATPSLGLTEAVVSTFHTNVLECSKTGPS